MEKLNEKEKQELLNLLDSDIAYVEVHLINGISIKLPKKVFENLTNYNSQTIQSAIAPIIPPTKDQEKIWNKIIKKNKKAD